MYILLLFGKHLSGKMASILYLEVTLKYSYSRTYYQDGGGNLQQESIECQNIREWIQKHEESNTVSQIKILPRNPFIIYIVKFHQIKLHNHSRWRLTVKTVMEYMFYVILMKENVNGHGHFDNKVKGKRLSLDVKKSSFQLPSNHPQMKILQKEAVLYETNFLIIFGMRGKSGRLDSVEVAWLGLAVKV